MDWTKFVAYADAAILGVDSAIFVPLVCWMVMDRTNTYWREPKA